MMDWESHRIVTRVRRAHRALVFTHISGRPVVRRPLGPYASRDTLFDSMEELESWVRQRGWCLEKVKHFS
jgi:hypothetical protein